MLLNIRDESNVVALFNFAQARSDMFSVARYYNGRTDDGISLAEQPLEIQMVLKHTQQEFESWIERNRRILGFETLDQARQYFDAHLNHQTYLPEGEASAPNTRRVLTAPEIPEEEQEKPFCAKSQEYLGKWYTHMTPVTTGPLFEICYFRCGTLLSELPKKMRTIYDREILIDGVVFEDPAFYRNGECILSICSHEHLAWVKDDDVDFVELSP